MKKSNPKQVWAPPYYQNFTCIAQRCRHSCCIGWEIGIDEKTCALYRTWETDILSTVGVDEDGAHFILCQDGTCPHLNAMGLCNIILTHGEDCLPDICQYHPRFFHQGQSGKTEAGLGIVCEEACRLVMEQDGPFSLLETEEKRGAPCFTERSMRDFAPIEQRKKIMAIIDREELDFWQTVMALQSAFDLPFLYSMKQWIARFLSLEILDSAWKKRLRAASKRASRQTENSPDSYDVYEKRFLRYFVYRHVSTAQSPCNLRARLAFAILSVRMIRLLFSAQGERSKETLMEIARQYSSEIEYSEENTADLIFEFESAY